MICTDARGKLDDYEDGLLTEAELHEVELHLAACADCRAEVSRLRALIRRASSVPREMDPPRDLWPDIVDRLAPREGRPPVRRLRRFLAHPVALAAAAAVFVALATVTVRRETAAPTPTGAPAPIAARASDDHVQAAEVDYIRATGQLMGALDARRGSLSPETRNAVDENLRVIDDALKQVRDALEEDPGNRQLTRMLASTHQKKLDLLLRLLKLTAQI